MKRHDKSEVARLTALVQSIPEPARKAYEQNVLGGKTLTETVKEVEKAFKEKALMTWIRFVNILFFMIFSCLMVLGGKKFFDIGPVLDLRHFLMIVLVLSFPVIILLLLSLRDLRNDRVIESGRRTFKELEKNLTALGLHSFEDLTEGKVRSMLQNFASLYLICETGLQLSCDNWKTIGLPNVPGVAVRYVEANDEFNTAMTTAELFGFKFTRREMVGYAQDVNESFSTC